MAFFNEFSNFFKFQPEKKSLELKNIFFETSSQKGMLGQNKKKFDFSSLIFDSRNILAASLNTLSPAQKRNIWRLNIVW